MERIRGPGTGDSQTVRLDSYRKVFFVSPQPKFRDFILPPSHSEGLGYPLDRLSNMYVTKLWELCTKGLLFEAYASALCRRHECQEAATRLGLP